VVVNIEHYSNLATLVWYLNTVSL